MVEYKRLTDEDWLTTISINDTNDVKLIEYAFRLWQLENQIKNGELAEVKHGKWIFESNGIHIGGREACSVCGKWLPSVITRDTCYCPNCGAKMDLKEEE